MNEAQSEDGEHQTDSSLASRAWPRIQPYQASSPSPHRRADQVADVLDRQHRAGGRLQLGEPARHHLGLQVAAGEVSSGIAPGLARIRAGLGRILALAGLNLCDGLDGISLEAAKSAR